MSDSLPADLPETKVQAARLSLSGPITVTQGGAPPARGGLPTIPGYDILREMGRGGMGVVYAAEQVGLKRLVALKVILAGSHAGEDQLRRFRAEAEAIARLQHPNIVQVYDIGEHEGKPFFALEFINGGSLSSYLRGEPQPPRAVAQLIETLARAMQHAHERGVIHRDLKPGNVLLMPDAGQATVDTKDKTLTGMSETPMNPAAEASGAGHPQQSLADLVPKITDFGLAKQLDSNDERTQSGALLGTPNYMAPEQAKGRVREIGPATDVHALGTIMYEALTGRLPFKGASLIETLEQIESLEPVPVSRLQARVPRDLETICLKCLAKDPRKRFPEAGQLADDLRRFLDGLPIRARAVGKVERAWRWCRRNPVVAGLTVGLFLALILGLAGVTWKWREAENQRELVEQAHAVITAERNSAVEARDAAEKARTKAVAAEAEAKKSLAKFEAVHKFLVEDMLAWAEPYKAKGQQVTVAEVLRQAAPKIDQAFLNDPDVASQLHDTIGEIYLALGHYADAEEHLRKVLNDYRRRLGPENYATLRAMNQLAMACLRGGKRDEARAMYEELVAICSRVVGEEHPDTLSALNNLANLLPLEDSLPLIRRVVESRRRLGMTHDSQFLSSLNNLGTNLYLQGKPADAEPLLREVWESWRKTLSEENENTMIALNNLATVVSALGKMDEAEELYRKALAIRRRILGSEHPNTLLSMNNLAAVLQRSQDKWSEAEAIYREAVAIQRRKPPANRYDLFQALTNLGTLLRDEGKVEEAESLFREVVAGKAAGESPDLVVTTAQEHLAWLLHDQKKWAEAARHGEELLRERRKTAKNDPLGLGRALLLVGRCYQELGRTAEAEPLLREYVTVYRSVARKEPWLDAEALSNLGDFLIAVRRFEEAESTLLQSHDGLTANQAPLPKIRTAAERLVRLYDAWNKPEEAAKWRAKSEEHRRRSLRSGG